MNKIQSLCRLAGVVSCLTLTPISLAKSYDITQGNIAFTKNANTYDMDVTQNSVTDTYIFTNNIFPSIVIYGNSTVTENIITIDTDWNGSEDHATPIIFSNVLIQSSANTPVTLFNKSILKLFLSANTSNELTTTEEGYPGLYVPASSSAKLKIKGSGTLLVNGGESSPGIGGDFYSDCGAVTIEDSVTVVARGGMGGAGIGGGEATHGGNITITSNATVIARGGNGGTNIYDDTLGGAAGIGGGGPSTFSGSIGGNGGTVAISGNARVTAQAGENAAGIGGGEAGGGGDISIGPSTRVIAISDGTRPAIEDSDNTVGGDGYVLHATYYATKTNGTTTTVRYPVYTTRWNWVVWTNATPAVDYQSIAFSVSQTNTYRLYHKNVRQEHQEHPDFDLTETGLSVFTNVTDVGGVIVSLDPNGGDGGTTEVVATFGDPMPSATAPTNSNTSLAFDGYYLDDETTQYYNADMTSARNCDKEEDFTLYAKWVDARTWDGTTRTYDWYTNQASPYTIRTAAQLAGLAAVVNGTAPSITRDTFSGKQVNLAADLNLAGNTWTPVGNVNVSSLNIFQGTFNGGAHSITGLAITASSQYQALFGKISSTATISNLTVYATLKALDYVAAFVGYNDGGKLRDCAAHGTLTATNRVGGIVGESSGGSILDCTSDMTIKAYYYVGGIVGTSSGTIGGCTSSSSVEADDWVGGIVGNLSSAGSLRNCSCSGSLSGLRYNTYAGGIIGANAGLAQNSRCDAGVTGMGASAYVGGIAGWNSGRIQDGLMLGTLAFGSSTRVGGIVGENTSNGTLTNGYFVTSAGVSKAIGINSSSAPCRSLGSFANPAGQLTATDSTSLLYGTQLHLALNRWVYGNNGNGLLLWWTTETTAYPDFTGTRPEVTLSTPTAVPFTWLATYYPEEQEGNYETLAQSTGQNGFSVWGSYVAGLTPTNAASTFTASIVLTNGTPYISWTPNLPNRTYTVQGKTNVTDSTWGATNSANRFFNVKVEIP